MVLTMHGKWVLAFSGEDFQPAEASHYWEMMVNQFDIFICFLRKIQPKKCWLAGESNIWRDKQDCVGIFGVYSPAALLLDATLRSGDYA